MEIEKILHHFCLFYKDEKLTAGWIKEIQKKGALVTPLKGKNIVLTPKQVGLTWLPLTLESQESVALKKLLDQFNQIKEKAQQLEINVIHELCEPGKKYTLDQLVLDFIDSPADPLQKVSLFFALDTENRFFKKRNLDYIARTETDIQQIIEKEQQDLKKQQLEEKIKQWIIDIDSGKWTNTSNIDDEQASWIKQIKSILIYSNNSAYWKLLSSIFKLTAPLKEEHDRRLRNLLSQIGHPLSWGKLTLLRSAVHFEFSKKILGKANHFSERVHHDEDRKKWVDLPTFSIDSEKTSDFDDAFSIIESSDNQIKVAIHITDLSGSILPGDDLFEEAEKRLFSVYTLKEVFPMLPPSLANNYFSLKEGVDRLAISFIFDLTTDGEYQLEEIVKSTIHVNQNLTYEEADLKIEKKEKDWVLLNNCCQILRQTRIKQGALDFEREEVEIEIDDPENIKIVPINRNTPSNKIIEELAILVNRSVGQFFFENSCPGIYRTQAPYEILEEFKNEEKLKIEYLAIEPARLSTIPDKHSGLGCDLYIQATSPIRRFTDLVTQHQLSCYLKDKTIAFEEEQLMTWAEQSLSAQKEYAQVERTLQKHWKAKYLLQHKGEKFSGTIKRHLSGGKTEVFFEDIQYYAQTSNLSQFSLGERVLLQIDNVDVHQHFLFVSAVVDSLSSQ